MKISVYFPYHDNKTSMRARQPVASCLANDLHEAWLAFMRIFYEQAIAMHYFLT